MAGLWRCGRSHEQDHHAASGHSEEEIRGQSPTVNWQRKKNLAMFILVHFKITRGFSCINCMHSSNSYTTLHYPALIIQPCLQVVGFEQARGSFGHTVQYRGPVHCLTSIYRQEGLLAFYKGATPAIMKVAIQLETAWDNNYNLGKEGGREGYIIAVTNQIQPYPAGYCKCKSLLHHI